MSKFIWLIPGKVSAIVNYTVLMINFSKNKQETPRCLPLLVMDKNSDQTKIPVD